MELLTLIAIFLLIVGSVAWSRSRRRPAVDDPHRAAVSHAEAERRRDTSSGFPGGLNGN